MKGKVIRKVEQDREKGKKSIAILIDPDNVDDETCKSVVQKGNEHQIDYFFVGGSLITNANLNNVISIVKSLSDIPVILFPGSNLHIDSAADAILLLSLISGRNPDLLIGQHIISAPVLKRSNLEILSTGYILVDSGKQTTVSYISNSNPIPADKPSIAACTAMAGNMLGMNLIYLDAGSGALNTISTRMIGAVRRAIEGALIVGGGINTFQKAKDAFTAGADVVVVGTAVESDPGFIEEITSLTRNDAFL